MTLASAAVVEIGRAERNKRDKRERLIRAARELFKTKGFQSTTTSEIAELADVAKGTLFFHAKSKESLLVMMFQEEVGDAINRAFAKVPDAPFIEQLMHVFEVMLRQNQRDVDLARVFVKELAFVRGERHGIDLVMAGFFDKLGSLIERAKDRGEVAVDVDAALLGHNLFALYFVFLMLWLGSGAAAPEAPMPSLRAMIELQLQGVSATLRTRRSNRKR
jgi:TetR/AcrR family transcriptional regulator, cholesterol catabolism regulator